MLERGFFIPGSSAGKNDYSRKSIAAVESVLGGVESDAQEGCSDAKQFVCLYRQMSTNATVMYKCAIRAIQVAKDERVFSFFNPGMMPGDEVIVRELNQVVLCPADGDGEFGTFDQAAVLGSAHDFDDKKTRFIRALLRNHRLKSPPSPIAA